MRGNRQENKEQIVSGFSAMMDYALRVRREKAEDFVRAFVRGGVADKLGRGDVLLIGLSGVELYEKVTGKKCFDEHVLSADSVLVKKARALAEFQVDSGRSFKEIFRVLTVNGALNGAMTTAEEFASAFDLANKKRPTNLEYFRSEAGLSQSELALASGVDIRSIQMYEQRRNDISRAQYNILNALAGALCCTVSDLTDEDNFRLPKGTADENPIDTFVDVCMLEMRRRQFRERYGNFYKAQRQARQYFYAYGYLGVFPLDKLTVEKGSLSIDPVALKNSFTVYFYRVIDSKKAREAAKASAKQQIASVCPEGKKLTAAALVQAVLSAARIAEDL